MSHKVHPKAFRIRTLQDWKSRWLDLKKTPQYLEEDFKIRNFIWEKLGKIGIEEVEIERSPNRVIVIIATARPGFIIGRGGEGITELKKELTKKIIEIRNIPKTEKTKFELRVEIKEIRKPWISAALSAQWIVQQIEKRVPYRRVLKSALEKIITNREVKGAKVQVAGRLNGIDIARREWLKKGRLPRQTLRADIDYATANAFCTYGVIGVKVWIYKGDRFD